MCRQNIMQQQTVMEASGSVPTLCSKNVLSLSEPEWLQVYWSHTIQCHHEPLVNLFKEYWDGTNLLNAE